MNKKIKSSNFLFRSIWHFKIALLFKLPSVLFWGVKLRSIDEDSCQVMIRHNWRNTNPFKSIYFSALAGTGELSTGLLVIRSLNNRKDISMLVTSTELNFFKKAEGEIEFTCNDGKLIDDTINKLKQGGDSKSILVKSYGVNYLNETVMEMTLEWSFKKRY